MAHHKWDDIKFGTELSRVKRMLRAIANIKAEKIRGSMKSNIDTEILDTLNVDHPSPEFMQHISRIRRCDFIDGDTAATWDPWYINNLQTGKQTFTTGVDGILKEDVVLKDFVEYLEKEYNLKRVLVKSSRDDQKKLTSQNLFYASEDVQLVIYAYETYGYSSSGGTRNLQNGLQVTFATSNEQKYKALDKYLNSCVVEQKNEGCIYVLKSTSQGVNLVEAGYAASPLVPENYTPEVIEQYNHMLADLQSANPCGRLSVMSGEPGCGKSYMIRGLLEHAQKMKFILVRPELITHLGDPEFVGVLINQREDNIPFVFILEDADQCLTQRMSDNMGAISAILNTSDGILGSTLDLRIIATTNANRVEFDPAIRRPGRLCTEIHVDKLSISHAHDRFKALAGITLEEAHMQINSDPNAKDRSTKIGFTGALTNNKHRGFTVAEVYKAKYLYDKAIGKN